MNVKQWVADIKSQVNAEKETIYEALRILAGDGTEFLVKNSAVETGRYRANWNFSINGIIPPANEEEYDHLGYRTINKQKANAMALLPTGAAIHSLTWSNALIYAYPLEYGHSNQMPDGNIRVMQANIERMWQKAFKEAQQNARRNR